ncbi:DNA mismatch repair protein MutS [Candidatus Gracilibacteria bacterium]|nr:DNA mismatch repair protein MutS [Candidatus Gracilibacteria bacterium]
MPVDSSTPTKKLTPMLRQYFSIKANHQDCILLFRLGDFYEMFASDAEIASSVLHLALTARHKGSENEIAMCGFPHFSSEQYIRKLIKAGYKIAICNQTSSPDLPGIVERSVTRVVTPGTMINDTDEQHQIRLLAAINQRQGYWEILFCNVSTGELLPGHGTTLPDIIDQIRIRDPQELLIPASLIAVVKPLLDQSNLNVLISSVAAGNAPDTMLRQYISQTQQTEAYHLHAEQQSTLPTVALDEMTVRNLDIVRNAHDGKVHGSLLDSINATVTAHGYRLLHSMLLHPLADAKLITHRLDLVTALCQSSQFRQDIQGYLKQCSDIEKVVAKIALKSASPRDLGHLLATLQVLLPLASHITQFPQAIISNLAQALVPPTDILNLLTTALSTEILPLTAGEGEWIRPGFDPELDQIRSTVADSQQWLSQYEAEEQQKTEITNLKVRFNNITGFFIEISKASLRDATPEKIAHLIRKQTLVNAERYSSTTLHAFEATYLTANEKAQTRQTVLFDQLCQQVIAEKDRLQELAQQVAELDVWVSHAETATQYHFVRPTISDDETLTIEGGRHPIIAKKMGPSFIANDTELDQQDHQLMLITGPNMGGKSTYLRQVALIEILFLIGSFVPATRAHLPMVDRIFTRIGAQDHLLRGMSTFMVEMSETANILRSATSKSLIILDEIGRGTSTYDGLSIAWAICEYLVKTVKAKTLFATHYHELINVVDKLPGAFNASVAIAEQNSSITFLYKIVPGGVGKSYGLEVARRAGLPSTVLQQAKQILHTLETAKSPDIKQPTLLDSTTEPTVEIPTFVHELNHLDINQLSPMEALLKLKEWKDQNSNYKL